MIRLILIAVLLISGFSDKPQHKYDFHGKYSLYIQELEGQWQINWRTSVSEEGTLTVYANGNKIEQYKTPASILHRQSINKPSSEIKMVFGGTSGTESIFLNPRPKRHPTHLKGVDSIYVLGDVHGHFNETVTTLKNGKLIDDDLHWIGGSVHLVFVGDVLDRGIDPIRLIWLIYELEQEAERAGGGVHLVLGNHEIMVMSNDLRYVTAKEKQIAQSYQVEYNKMFDPHTTLIGQWMTTKPGIFKIDEVLFAHGGVITNYGNYSAQIFNDSLHKFMQEPVFKELMNKVPDTANYSRELWEERRAFFYDSYGPFWYRGYAQYDSLSQYLNLVLSKHKSSLHVVGHTPGPKIRMAYNGKFIATNVEKFGTEMLLLVKNRKKYLRYSIDSQGNISKL